MFMHKNVYLYIVQCIQKTFFILCILTIEKPSGIAYNSIQKATPKRESYTQNEENGF